MIGYGLLFVIVGCERAGWHEDPSQGSACDSACHVCWLSSHPAAKPLTNLILRDRPKSTEKNFGAGPQCVGPASAPIKTVFDL